MSVVGGWCQFGLLLGHSDARLRHIQTAQNSTRQFQIKPKQTRQQIFLGAQQHKHTSSLSTVPCHVKPYKSAPSFISSWVTLVLAPNVLTYKHRMQCLAVEKMVQPHERGFCMDRKKWKGCQWESKRSRLNREDGTMHRVITAVYEQTDVYFALLQRMRNVWEGLRKLNTGRKGRRHTIWEKSPTRAN